MLNAPQGDPSFGSPAHHGHWLFKYIDWLHVPWQEIIPAALVYWDNSPTNLSAWPGLAKFNWNDSELPAWRQEVRGQTQKCVHVVPNYIRYLPRL